MQRNYVKLVGDGVSAYRILKEAPKGRLMCSVESLDMYLKSCQLTADFGVFSDLDA